MGKILVVTGATGAKSGSAFTRKLAEHSEEINHLFPDGVRFLVREPEKLKKVEFQTFAVDIRRGYLEDEEYVSKSLEDVDTVVHIAGIQHSLNIVRAAVENHIRRLIFVHTTGIYSKYKAAGEVYRNIDANVYQTCKKHGVLLTILRPTMIYGNIYDNNVIHFIEMVDKLPILPVVNGARYKLQPVYYEDLAEAYYRVLVNEEATVNKDFNLSGGEEIELREVFKVIADHLGKNIRFINCPFPIAYAGAWTLYIITLKRKDYREKVQRLCEPRTFSYVDAKEAFGYYPRTFRAGVIKEVKEYQKRGR